MLRAALHETLEYNAVYGHGACLEVLRVAGEHVERVVLLLCVRRANAQRLVANRVVLRVVVFVVFAVRIVRVDCLHSTASGQQCC